MWWKTWFHLPHESCSIKIHCDTFSLQSLKQSRKCHRTQETQEDRKWRWANIFHNREPNQDQMLLELYSEGTLLQSNLTASRASQDIHCRLTALEPHLEMALGPITSPRCVSHTVRRHIPMRHIPMRHIPMATFTHGRHLPMAFTRCDAWFIRYLVNVAYG